MTATTLAVGIILAAGGFGAWMLYLSAQMLREDREIRKRHAELRDSVEQNRSPEEY